MLLYIQLKDEELNEKSNYERLAGIAGKQNKLILGLMSGTSMDGLDVALCRISGQGVNTSLELLEFDTLIHPKDYKKKIHTVFAREDADVSVLARLHQYVAEVNARQILESLDQWNISPEKVDLIASHGQTVYHNPATKPFQKIKPKPVTIQLGDGDFIAHQTGIITMSDFRQKHIAAGGEGAPLALYGDMLLFSTPDESRILLNIGGVANFTFLPPAKSGGLPICTDTGPGNTILDAYMHQYFGSPYDRDAAVGLSGKVDEALLHGLLDDPFFERSLPRTTGPELFNLEYLKKRLKTVGKQRLSDADIMATLHAFTTDSILSTLKPYLEESSKIYISGGGAHNPLLVKRLETALPDHYLKTTQEIGINPDAKEAIIFALLANECLFGLPNTYPEMGPQYPKTSMGKISFP